MLASTLVHVQQRLREENRRPNTPQKRCLFVDAPAGMVRGSGRVAVGAGVGGTVWAPMAVGYASALRQRFHVRRAAAEVEPIARIGFEVLPGLGQRADPLEN